MIVDEEQARGVVLADGRSLDAALVVSGIDPKSTFCGSAIRWRSAARSCLARVRNYRAKGTLAKVNLALSALPAFAGADRERSPAASAWRPASTIIERAFDHLKYGRYRPIPVARAVIPSLVDDRWRRGAPT